MTDNKTPGWGPKRPWTCLGQITPSDVKPGDLIQSNQIVRAERLAASRAAGRPDYIPVFEWTVGNGSAFMEKLPDPSDGTHMVASWYRVWQGPRPDGFEMPEGRSEEEDRRLLLDLQNRKGKKERRKERQKELKDVDVETLVGLVMGFADVERVP
ncbi:hypothetical protein [Aliiruegeria lutimaris]|uniref:Uncharacterized protein n=1 Tax=Aliiruegeria lutimaris TaxID=571298 RepID=A0A1G9L6S8_9RHOB|nr:hypothetical protein [Aliiruegeria lutimaris]SDL57688.1 hypothetical protein SAMN04488026_10955 [Aliiruegeria lutimaris]